MAATPAANIAEALVIIPPGSIRWARRPTSSRWHLQARSRVIRPGATQAAGPEAVSAGPARQFCARDSLGPGANPERADAPEHGLPEDRERTRQPAHKDVGRSTPSIRLLDRAPIALICAHSPTAGHAHLAAPIGGSEGVKHTERS